MMKFGKKAKIAAISFALISPLLALAPVIAEPTSGALIDKEFETAVSAQGSDR